MALEYIVGCDRCHSASRPAFTYAVRMADHLLHLDSIDECGGNFRLTCHHKANARWHGGGEDGRDAENLSEECNLMSWWDNLGMELFHDEQDVPRIPGIPVHADGWADEAPELRVVPV